MDFNLTTFGSRESRDLVKAITELAKAATCYLQGLKQTSSGHFDLRIGPVTPKINERIHMTAISITNEQQVVVTLSPQTPPPKSKPAKLDGVPTWTVISGNSTVTPSDNGLSATLVSEDEAGDTVINVEADADLGEGVETISDQITLTVTSARAANLGLTVSEPTDKPLIE